MNAHDEWAGILAEGEEVLWQGRPEPGIRLEFSSVFEAIFGLFFTGFSVVWMALASMAGGFFWMFGLLFFFVGIQGLIGQHFWKAYKRRHSFYTLTDRRALIATDLPLQGRRLASHTIERDALLELSGNGPHDVIFARRRKKTGKRTQAPQQIGFQRIEDGQKVFGMLRDIQVGLNKQATQDQN